MAKTEDRIVIKDPFIIDGTGREPYKASILIRNGKITEISAAGIKEMPTDTVIDAIGHSVLPGMIDCHVHVMINQYNLMAHLGTPFSLNFFRAINNLDALLRAGITSARDAGGADLGVKRALQEGLVAGPKLKISISPLSITGGHLDAWMPSGMQLHLLNPPYPGNPSGICDGADEVRKRVREILRAGADVIKTCSTGGVTSPTDHPEFTQFTIEELKIMVQEGNMRKGVKVMAHAQGLEGIKNAIKAGIHSIEHGIYLDNEAVDLMLENDVFLVPTLLAVNSVITGPYPEEYKEQAKEVQEAHWKSIEKAHTAGVKIAMGTDSGVMCHGLNLKELKLMCDLGMTPMQSISASTLVAAQCLEIDRETGSVEVGKTADLLLVKEDPLKNIGSLGDQDNLIGILQDGAIIK